MPPKKPTYVTPTNDYDTTEPAYEPKKWVPSKYVPTLTPQTPSHQDSENKEPLKDSYVSKYGNLLSSPDSQYI